MAGRKRTGTLVPTGRGFSARIAGGKLVPLHTADRELAVVRMRELVAGGPSPEPGAESFKEACTRVCAVLERDGMRTADERLSRLRRYAWPVLGHLAVTSIKSGQISSVLEAARAAGLALDTVKHLHVDMSKVFAELVRDEVLEYNPAKGERVRIPKIARDRRKRVLLTDSEFTAVFAHHVRGPRRQLAIMALVSRCFGGLRPSDMHAWVWEDLDRTTWMWADAPRPKTEHHADEDAEPAPRERLGLPQLVAATLRGWWDDAGKPDSGLVFPLQKHSYARDLRAALLEADITRAELHDATDKTKRTDFYSFRRSYVTAVAASGLNAQTAMRASGHKSMTTHQRYHLPDVIHIPAAALPAAPQDETEMDFEAALAEYSIPTTKTVDLEHHQSV
jgi:hypothetical protein